LNIIFICKCHRWIIVTWLVATNQTALVRNITATKTTVLLIGRETISLSTSWTSFDIAYACWKIRAGTWDYTSNVFSYILTQGLYLILIIKTTSTAICTRASISTSVVLTLIGCTIICLIWITTRSWVKFLSILSSLFTFLL